MNLFKQNLLKSLFSQLRRHVAGWQDVGYVTILVLSALSAIAFLGEYQAQGEPSSGSGVDPFSTPVETQVQESL